MQFKIEESERTAKVILTGRLDLPGAEAIALPLAVLTHSNTVVIDMIGVPSIALIGLRHLVSTAKWIKRRGGYLILLNPNSAIREIITTAGFSELLHVICNGGGL